MIKETEENFVKKFIRKDKRDRVLFELYSVKKCGNAVQRIFYELDEKYSIISDNRTDDEVFFKAAYKFINKNDSCYVIADCNDDGKILPIKTACANMAQTAGVYYIICDNKVVLAKEEVCYGAPCKKLLFREN